MQTTILAAVLVTILSSGCASTVAKILPIGEPVTKERCESLDMKALGVKDGSTGQRINSSYEFWVQDCRAFKVKLDRAVYEAGFQEGQLIFCSCNKGFTAGVKGEYLEIMSQQYTCSKANYANFTRGHAAGYAVQTDETMVQKKGVNYIYNEEAIQARAQQFCSANPVSP